MAPQLRSRTRAATQGSSRPSTSLDAPQNNTTAAGSENSRPKKQRKTGANTSVPVDSEEPTRQRQRKTRVGPSQADQESTQQQASQDAAPQQPALRNIIIPPLHERNGPPCQENNWYLPKSTWKEPPEAKLRPSFVDAGWQRGGIFQSQFALGARPTRSNLKIAKLLEDEEPVSTPKPAPKPAPKKKPKSKRGRVAKSRWSRKKSKKSTNTTKSAKAAEAVEQAINESTAASTSAQESTTPEDTPTHQADENITGDNEHDARQTRSASGSNLDTNGAEPVNSSTAPSIPVDLKCSRERFNEVLGSAISRAEASQDTKVAEGLRWMLDASGTDPFLLKIMDNVVAEPTTDNMSVFQTALRDAVKKAKAEKPAATTAAAALGREDSTSSLSTAKSLEAEALAAASSEPADVPVPVSEEVAQAAESENVGSEQAASTGSGVAPVLSGRGRKRRPEDPELVALAAKKSKLLKEEFPGYHVRESDVRTQIVPQPQPPRRVVRLPEDDDVISVGSDETRRSRAHAEEVDNIDFCRVCNGTGNLLCCDGCVDSFHFGCLNPPLDANFPPAGRWFCTTCEEKGPGAVFEAAMGSIPRARYEVPTEIREEFAEVHTAPDGSYQLLREERLPPTVTEGVSELNPKQKEERRPEVFVERDAKGKLIFCAKCHRANLDGERQIMKCDHCSLYWHLDCLDENYTHPPLQFSGSSNPRHYWKCPNHLDNMLHALGGVRLRRRRRHHEHEDLELLPPSYEIDNFHEQEFYGKSYRVSERGLIQNFIQHVKREYAEDKALKAMKAAEEQARALLVPAGGTPGSSSEVANADSVLANLRPEEREGAMALLVMAEPQPASSRVGQLVSQLVADSPETIRNATSEVDLLQSLQGLISQRLCELAATSSTDVTN
ncbi:hypothetical protein D8B26_007817 [Coccidioides posadasii str. Silveira]|uniref:uncharacterized protein n=1 Tax=Coccidioides posadasii (strain RMSCC 757 / Silveira) TaxID=443226 RepID=UPI001BEED25A|nr:hypothetical protein D8B26_007817 [Coccidioides posadasii str. Silveira]